MAAIGLCAQRLPKLANICLEGLLSLAKNGIPSELFFVIFFSRHNLYEIKHIADLLTGEDNALDGEASIQIQAVMSIKAIISHDPPSHDKVLFFCILMMEST